MKDQGIIKDAQANLQTSELKEFQFDHADLTMLNNWTYLGMFLHEASRSIVLSEEFKKKDTLPEMDEMIKAHALFKNAILSYAKCFSSSGNGRISLDANTVYSNDAKLKAVHERIMEIRNTFAAHNGLNNMDVSIIATYEQDNEIVLAQTYTISTPLSEFEDFKSAIDHAQTWVIENFNKKIDKIQERIGKTIVFK